MPTALLNDPDTLFFAGRALLLVFAFLAFAIALGRWRRAGSRDMQALIEQLDESRNETRSLARLTAAMGEQIASLSQRLDERLQLAQATSVSGGSGIDVAIRLARQGCDVDEIVKTCGVTRQEAQLLARLHGTDAHHSA